MINDVLDKANALHKQLQQLAVEVKALRKERDVLKVELENSQRKLDQLYAQNRTFQTALDVNGLANALHQKNDSTELRQRLNKLIKELDTVIHYIESEK